MGSLGAPIGGPSGFLPQIDIPLIQAYHFVPQKDPVDLYFLFKLRLLLFFLFFAEKGPF